MDGNSNEQGQKYTSLAIKGRNDHDALPSAAYEQFSALEKRLNVLWVKSANDEERKRVIRYVGVMSRLSSFLLQVRRVADNVKRLTEGLLVPSHTLSQGVGASMALSADELCTDFESLLFHGRAVLDKLTHTISAEYEGKGFRFSRLKNELSNHKEDKRANRVSALIDRGSQLTGTLINVGVETALRSKVAHYGSITENPRHCFSLHGIEGKRVLIFDCESLGYPVVTTAHRLSQAVPYIVGNSLAVYLGCKLLQTNAYTPSWTNPTVVYTDHLSKAPDARQFSVFRMNPDGFTVNNNGLDPSVVNKAISTAL